MWSIAQLCTGTPVRPAVRGLTNKGLLSFTCLSPRNLVTTHFFLIVWYHLHPLGRKHRRTLSSIWSIAWSLGQDRGTDAQILWALLPGISPTRGCFFSKLSGSSCRLVRGQCHSLESRLPVLSPLALLSILMVRTAPSLRASVSKVTASAKGAKKQRVWTDALSCPHPQSLVQLCQEFASSEEVRLEKWLWLKSTGHSCRSWHRLVLSSHKAAYNLL